MLKTIAILAATTSLAVSSVASAQSFSLANAPARALADVSGASELNGSTRTTRLAVLIAVDLLIWGGIDLFDDDDRPESP